MPRTSERAAGSVTLDGADVREAWEAIAPGYDAFVTPTHFGLGDEVLERAGVGPGDRFLDVAAGSGALALPAARRGASVLATDISATMLERLAARARAEGLDRVEVRVMDAHALDLEDGAVDVAGSQFGVMLVPDQPRALRELVRVTRPGGRVVVAVYGPPAQIEFLQFFLRAIRAVLPGFEGLPADPPPLPFQAADPAVLHGRLEAAGLHAVRVETTAEVLEFESGEQLWSWLVNSNPVARMLIAGLDDVQLQEVRTELSTLVRDRAGTSGSARLTNPVHIGLGVV